MQKETYTSTITFQCFHYQRHKLENKKNLKCVGKKNVYIMHTKYINNCIVHAKYINNCLVHAKYINNMYSAYKVHK